jgi:hypothetical protein
MDIISETRRTGWREETEMNIAARAYVYCKRDCIIT